MPEQHEQEGQEPKTEAFTVTRPINIKGRAYAAGEKVNLTEEEHSQMVEAGMPLEGVEPLSPEDIQSKHEEGVEAQKKRLEEDMEEVDEDEPESET